MGLLSVSEARAVYSAMTVTAEDITAALNGKWHGSYGSARCPAHDDRSPSLSISNGRDVSILLNCHANCPYESIVAAIEARGIRVRNDRPFNPPVLPVRSTNGKHIDEPVEPDWSNVTPLRPNVAKVYDYRDEHGVVLFQKVRKPPKDFYQQRPDGTRNLEGVRRVLYRLPELLASPDALVWLCEGEKDADRLTSMGMVATTNPEGGGKWDAEYTRELMGRTVVILQDNDETGAKHVRLVSAALHDVATAGVLLLPGLPEKGDVSDWLDNGGSVEALQDLATAALSRQDYPLQTLAQLLETSSIDEPELVQGLLWRGRTHWLFSAPNSGKTLLAIAVGMHIAAGRPFHGRQLTQGTVLMIEEDSPLSVIAEYVTMLSDIYEIDLDGLPFYITKEPGLRVTDESGKQRILDIVHRYDPLPIEVIFDSSERVIPSDKFSTKEFDPFGSALQVLSNEGITIIVIDHTRKLPNPTQAKNGKTAPRIEPDPIDMLYGGRVKSSIADVMMYMTGKVSKDASLRFVKFRGEEPPPMTIGFQPDDGFSLHSAARPSTRTPTEQAIIGWIQNGHSLEWHSSDEIFAGAGVKARTGERALTALVKRQWLIKEGVAKGAQFRLNPGLPGRLE